MEPLGPPVVSERTAHWALRVLAGRLVRTAQRERWGRMEPLGQPVVSVRTARRVRWGPPEPPVQSERQGRKEPLEQ